MGLSVALSQPAFKPLRIATWNLQSCRRGIPGIVAVLRDLAADVVALQEVDRRTARAGGLDQAAALAREAGFAHHHFYPALRWGEGDYGLALLSRWPLADARIGVLPNAAELEPRIFASAVLEIPEAPLALHVTHLTHVDTRSRLRLAQSKRIAKRLDELALPQLLLGDFNALPGSAAHRFLCGRARDVFREVGVGRGGTYPLPFLLPALRIDYAFASQEIDLVRAWVARTDASDHHALVADVGVPLRSEPRSGLKAG